MGAKRRSPVGPPLPTKEDLRRMHEDELMTAIEIGRVTGCGRRRIWKAIGEFGIPRRKRGPRSAMHHGSWSGGRTIDKDGYVLLYMPCHPDRDSHNRVREHRLVMERYLGRRLSEEEVVDHRNGKKSDNRLSNLRLFPTNADHLRATLTGKTPKWSKEGRERTLEGARRPRGTRQEQLARRLARDQMRKERDAPVSSEAHYHSTA